MRFVKNLSLLEMTLQSSSAGRGYALPLPAVKDSASQQRNSESSQRDTGRSPPMFTLPPASHFLASSAKLMNNTGWLLAIRMGILIPSLREKVG